jgi:osmotically-inducible protein OsmY
MTRLQTSKQRRTDAEILAEARHALHQRRTVPATVRVQVNGGTVKLTGGVYLPFERAEAEDTVRAIAGVERIINAITIAKEPGRKGFEPPDEVC